MFELLQRRRSAFSIGLAVVVLCLVYIAAPAFNASEQESSIESPEKKFLRYSFTLTNQTDEVVENAIFRAFAPVANTPYQKVGSIKSSDQFELTSDSLGNQELEFRVNNLPPYGQKVITVSVEVSMWNSSGNMDGGAISPALRQSSLIPLVDASDNHVERALNDIDSSPASTDPLGWLKAANSWVHQSIEDIGYVSRDRGALFALAERKGDCTEFMHALVALARTQQIPSLPVAGFRIDGSNAILKAMDYHNWVMFEAEGEWGVADPHANIFERQQGAYVVFRMLSTQAGYSENSQRFFSHDPRVKVAMN